ncbi:Actin-binding LIM protein 3 [Homalodisca vitripennis]|nr:Actin-binding LIM protein 3 [Homalodisca vitripennis]
MSRSPSQTHITISPISQFREALYQSISLTRPICDVSAIFASSLSFSIHAYLTLSLSPFTVSGGSVSEVGRGPLGPELATSSTYTGGLGYVPSYSPHLRRSLPNMAASHSSEPPKIYPYHLLLITNYRLPADVDRCNLEVSLSITIVDIC